jgi:ankyrin repeat protein
MRFDAYSSGRRHGLKAWGVGGLLALVLAGAIAGAAELPALPAQREADTRLLQAVQQGNLSLVKAAIVEGANVNCRNTNGLSPLLQTLSGAAAPIAPSRRECLAFLLERGALVDARDNDQRTALVYATRAGDLESVQLLVEAGSWVMLRDRFHKTALLYAADGHHRDIVAYLAVNGDLQSNSYAEKKARDH